MPNIRYLILLLFTLCMGCFEVDDPSEQWESGIIDPILAGKWNVDLVAESRKVDDFSFEFLQEDSVYLVKNLKEPKESPVQARSFIHDGFSFLLVFNPRQKQTLFFPYQSTAQGINVYIPNKQMGKTLQQHFPNRVYYKNTGIVGMNHVTTLDDDFLDQMTKLTTDPSQWAIAKMTKRQD